MKSSMLKVSNLNKSFGEKTVVNDVSFQVETGEVFGFLGPNGAGKTTTIRMILGLIHPDRGTIFINGHNMKNDFHRAIVAVGAVIETPRFYPYLSGYKNLLLIANLHRSIPKTRIDELLHLVGLTPWAADPVGTYSLGMKQRLGIARALINDPKLLFLDEPMNGLDPQGMLDVRELIKKLAMEKGTTIFITSHLLYEVEQLCTMVAILVQGKLLAQGKINKLLNRDSEKVLVYPRDMMKADQVLTSLSFVKKVQLARDHLSVELERGHSGELNAYLVNRGVEVNYLIPQHQSLEEYYIELTGRVI